MRLREVKFVFSSNPKIGDQVPVAVVCSLKGRPLDSNSDIRQSEMFLPKVWQPSMMVSATRDGLASMMNVWIMRLASMMPVWIKAKIKYRYRYRECTRCQYR